MMNSAQCDPVPTEMVMDTDEQIVKIMQARLVINDEVIGFVKGIDITIKAEFAGLLSMKVEFERLVFSSNKSFLRLVSSDKEDHARIEFTDGTKNNQIVERYLLNNFSIDEYQRSLGITDVGHSPYYDHEVIKISSTDYKYLSEENNEQEEHGEIG